MSELHRARSISMPTACPITCRLTSAFCRWSTSASWSLIRSATDNAPVACAAQAWAAEASASVNARGRVAYRFSAPRAVLPICSGSESVDRMPACTARSG
ncbi:hypothetical protein ASG41_22230 [Modestobacter sp. Leaf380]|nr:hypothetical protein ASG41_22230 [Modestobacter sp. Leaf380]